MAVLLSGLGGLLLSGAMPAPASAATQPWVELVDSVTDDLGRLEVRASSDSPITQIRARVLSPQTGEVLVAVDDLRLTDGEPTRGVWQTPDTLKLPALGEYPVEVEVTDADGDVSWPSSGSLKYWLLPVIERFTVTPPVADLDHRTVDAKGRLVGQAPDTRVRSPLAGVDIETSTGYDNFTTETDADGRFAWELPIPAPATISVFYRANQEEDQTYGLARVDPVDVRIDEAPTRILPQVTPTTVEPGEEVVLSGQLEYQHGGAWHSYAGASVEIRYADEGGGLSWDLVTTDADGTFTFTMAPARSGVFQLTYQGIADWYHGDSFAISAPIEVRGPSAAH